MGRRKSKRKPPQKRKQLQNMPTQFNCPFCNHELSCDVILNKLRSVGQIKCRVCLESFRSKITTLSEAVDVYNDWIDACEAIN